ncbi:6,7-dimethyl-8-ribityllumazine synthase [Lipomyces chichibuensis]|uniref:6,7-dimethyl-8-ribityllumazine synthase n=1 Tax=Lipomyces chichibuensis TaxID=1546026 RepID=UPI00334358AD
MASIKGPGHIEPTISGSDLRIGIVHARWNTTVISPLVAGAKERMLALGVKEENITIEAVPGSYELPFAVSRLYAASQIQSSAATSGAAALDLLAGDTLDTQPNVGTKPFDAIIAIGCLIKGETMHFEYICEAVSTSLMKIQLDLGIPVIFGVLACMTDAQALARAGVTEGGHNHGLDWGEAAVEMGAKSRLWNQGKI